MHKSANGAGKVTAKGLLPSAGIARLRENCLKRNVAMACSGDHYRRREKTIHEFRKQRDAHLNSFRRDAVPDHAQKVVVRDQIQNRIDERLPAELRCNPSIGVICLGRPFVFDPETSFSSSTFNRDDGVVILGIPELRQIVLRANL